jgi:hypothetical protein
LIMMNLEMPTDCYSCMVRKLFGCKIANASGWLNNRRDEGCPLIELVQCKNCDKRSQFDCPNFLQGVRPDDEWFCPGGVKRYD